ncbi:MAG: hypothetical protein AAF824_21125, partial [Bacteroidota bacterium]
MRNSQYLLCSLRFLSVCLFTFILVSDPPLAQGQQFSPNKQYLFYEDDPSAPSWRSGTYQRPSLGGHEQVYRTPASQEGVY